MPDPPTHLRVRLTSSDELLVLASSSTRTLHPLPGPAPIAAFAASTSLTAVRILDLDLQPSAAPSADPNACACGRTSLSVSMAALSELKLDMVRRWGPHACEPPRARRVVNLDCADLGGEGEGEEFRLAPALGAGTVVYAGVWEYDEFPRFVVDGELGPEVVVRVMAPGDEEEGEAGDGDEEMDGEGEGEEGEDAEMADDVASDGEWEDDDDDAPDPIDPQEAKIRALMAQTKYLPLAVFIAQAPNTRFTLVDVESWDEDEEGVADKLRAEIGRALGAGRSVDDAVRFLSLKEYEGEVGREVFVLEGENARPW